MCIRDRCNCKQENVNINQRRKETGDFFIQFILFFKIGKIKITDDCPLSVGIWSCLLYTSDAADERSSVDLGGRRIIKKKKNTQHYVLRGVVCTRRITFKVTRKTMD